MPQSNEQRRVSGSELSSLSGICHLYVKRRRPGKPVNNSSGVLIRDRYVLTAAHNVYSTFFSKVKSIEVSLGKAHVDGTETVRVRRWRVASGYSWKPFSRDFAVLKLPEPIQLEHPFSLGEVRSQSDVDGSCHIAGYPGASGGERSGKNMFIGTGVATHTSGSPMLDYSINTEGGNSGGPVWVEGDDGSKRIVGVHVTERNNSGRARVADIDLVNEVERMIAELG